MTLIETVLMWIGLVCVVSVPSAIAAYLYWCVWLTIRDSVCDARTVIHWLRHKDAYEKWLDETWEDKFKPKKGPISKPGIRKWFGSFLKNRG